MKQLLVNEGRVVQFGSADDELTAVLGLQGHASKAGSPREGSDKRVGMRVESHLLLVAVTVRVTAGSSQAVPPKGFHAIAGNANESVADALPAVPIGRVVLRF